MTRLLIANDCPEHLVGLNAPMLEALGRWGLRLLWHVRDDDVLVLPIAPDPGHLEYIAKLTRTRFESLRVVVPPAGRFGSGTLAGRLVGEATVEAVRDALAGRVVDSVVPLCPDAAVVGLARALGCEDAVAGAEFARQGGGVLANSKAVFRAVAAGAGVPLPTGTVTTDPYEAVEILAEMLLRDRVSVMAKRDFDQGCCGNEVLNASPGIEPIGGRRGLVLSDRAAIQGYVDENWSWLTGGGLQGRVVLERYYPNSTAVFAEFTITDRGAAFAGHGEMLAAPMADGQVVPPVHLSADAVAAVTDGSRRLAEAVFAMGYRGNLSADAIVTPAGDVFFTEYNGRITGSTHVYAVLGERVLAPGALRKRVLLERRGWVAPSFQGGVDALERAGLAIDRETNVGIALTGTFIPTRKVVSYTVVAEDLPAALALEKRMHEISPRAARPPVVASSSTTSNASAE